MTSPASRVYRRFSSWNDGRDYKSDERDSASLFGFVEGRGRQQPPPPPREYLDPESLALSLFGRKVRRNRCLECNPGRATLSVDFPRHSHRSCEESIGGKQRRERGREKERGRGGRERKGGGTSDVSLGPRALREDAEYSAPWGRFNSRVSARSEGEFSQRSPPE